MEQPPPSTLLLNLQTWEQKSEWVLTFLLTCTSRRAMCCLQLNQRNCTRKKTMKHLHTKGEKSQTRKAYIFFSTFTQSWKAESVCWTHPDAGLSLAETAGDTHCSRVWWVLSASLSMNYNSFKAAVIYSAIRGSLWEYIIYGNSAMQSCITAPVGPSTSLLFALGLLQGSPGPRCVQKHSSTNPLAARDKKKMAWDQLPVGCGAAAVQNRLPPAKSPLLRGKSLLSTRGHSQQPRRKKQKSKQIGFASFWKERKIKKKKKKKRNHIFMLRQCHKL